MSSTFAFFILCIKACLVQNIYSQCLNKGVLGPSLGQGFSSAVGCGSSVSQVYGATGLNSPADLILDEESYGGTGVGELYVNGMLPVDGYSSIVGQVPILGVVRFDGPIAAKGTVSISGACGCGCQ